MCINLSQSRSPCISLLLFCPALSSVFPLNCCTVSLHLTRNRFRKGKGVFARHYSASSAQESHCRIARTGGPSVVTFCHSHLHRRCVRVHVSCCVTSLCVCTVLCSMYLAGQDLLTDSLSMCSYVYFWRACDDVMVMVMVM